MLTIIISWMVLFVLISLVGRFFIKNGEWYEYFWVGLVSTIAILQIWSLFLPVNIYPLIFIAILACVSAIFFFRKGVKPSKIKLTFFFCSILILFAISYFASLSSGWPDTYGYHLNAVKWSSLYKVVPGLANLHTRLGFNSSFFLFASMMDNLFLKDRSTHVALSLIASVVSIEFLWLLFKSKNRHIKTFVLLVLPIFVANIVKSGQISSLSYDFAMLMVILAICIELIKGSKKSILIAVALSIMLVTIKLSGAVFSLVVVAYVVYKLFIEKTELKKIILTFAFLGSVLLIPYVVRNIILSGWPLYPLPALKLNISWAVPESRVTGLFEVIKAWAILPGSQYHNAIGLSVWKWFPSWLARNSGSYEIRIFFLTILFFVFSIFLKFISKKIIKQNTGLAICVAASFASIVYLIFSAPDLRFGGVFFWVFFASFGSFFFVELFKRHPYLEKFFVALSVSLVLFISWSPKLESEIMLKSIRWEQSQVYNQVLIVPKDGSSPFKIYTPEPDGSCGNSELPCTPEVNNNFKEIVPGDISKGFAPVN